jgi:hypothetical protein
MAMVNPSRTESGRRTVANPSFPFLSRAGARRLRAEDLRRIAALPTDPDVIDGALGLIVELPASALGVPTASVSHGSVTEGSQRRRPATRPSWPWMPTSTRPVRALVSMPRSRAGVSDPQMAIRFQEALRSREVIALARGIIHGSRGDRCRERFQAIAALGPRSRATTAGTGRSHD